MILIAYVPALFALIGLLMFMLAANPKAVRIGELIFFCGFLVTMMVLAKSSLRLP